MLIQGVEPASGDSYLPPFTEESGRRVIIPGVDAPVLMESSSGGVTAGAFERPICFCDHAYDGRKHRRYYVVNVEASAVSQVDARFLGRFRDYVRPCTRSEDIEIQTVQFATLY